jgi:hypothetical protein
VFEHCNFNLLNINVFTTTTTTTTTTEPEKVSLLA